jgi:6-phosphogluconolactonase
MGAIIRSFSSLDLLSAAAATEIVQLAGHAISKRGQFSLVLSGGATPKTLYDLLATKYHAKIDWQHVHLYWGDERYVPHNDPASNYRMAFETLISKIDIPEQNIHPIPTNFDNPQDAANAYADIVKDAMPFDLILLGLGDDGHTASLFPGPAFDPNDDRLVIVTHSPKPPVTRVSLTMKVVNASYRMR